MPSPHAGSEMDRRDMRCLALDRRFDGILAWDSFFHLKHEDQQAMFPIFAAQAAPGAILMFNAGFGNGEVSAHIAAILCIMRASIRLNTKLCWFVAASI
jgi:hypothetical protein